MSPTTLLPATLSGDPTSLRAPDLPALVVVWSRDEPARVGEVLVVPSVDPGQSWTFGRGAPREAGRRSLDLVRQRPGSREPTGPLACPRISRAQLRVEAAAGGGLVATNLGRCPLVHLGQAVSQAALQPGDVVELENELVLLCAHRPWSLAPLPADYPAPIQPFGEPDARGLVGEGPATWGHRVALAALPGPGSRATSGLRPPVAAARATSGLSEESVAAPALSARREDIPLLVRHLLRRLATSDPSLLRFFPGSDPRAAPRTTPDLTAALVTHRHDARPLDLEAFLRRAASESRGAHVRLTRGAARLLEGAGEAGVAGDEEA